MWKNLSAVYNLPIINLVDLEIVGLAFSSNIIINIFIKACILLNFIIRL